MCIRDRVVGTFPDGNSALLLVNPLMTVLRVDPAALAETRTYLLVVCGGLIGSIGYNLNAGILGGMGNSLSLIHIYMCIRDRYKDAAYLQMETGIRLPQRTERYRLHQTESYPRRGCRASEDTQVR